jgi:hypothetical protein
VVASIVPPLLYTVLDNLDVLARENSWDNTVFSVLFPSGSRWSGLVFLWRFVQIENTVSGFSATAIFTRPLYFSISNILGELSKTNTALYIYKLFINLLLYINKLTVCNFFHIAVLGIFYNIAYSINIHRISYTAKKRRSPTQNTCPDGWMFNSRGMCKCRPETWGYNRRATQPRQAT